MVAVVGGQGPQAVRREELVLVEELLEQALQAVDADDAEQQPAVAGLAAQQAAFGELLPCRRARGSSSSRANCLPTVSDRAITCSSTTTAASSGMMPTIERTLTGTSVPSGVTSLS